MSNGASQLSATRFRLAGRHYAVASLISRATWALISLGLVAVLPPAQYGLYAFVQINSGLTSQVVLGVFANVITSRISAAEPARRDSILRLALLWGLVVVVLAAAAAMLADQLSLTALGGGTIAAAGLWMFSGYAATIQTGQLLAERRYTRAALVNLLQPVLYLALVLGLLLGLHSTSGELVALCAATAMLIPSALSFAGGRRRGGTTSPIKVRTILGDYQQSMLMNVATIPLSVVLWLLVNALAAAGNHTQLAVYGVANQFIGLFQFFPTAIAGIAIARLTQLEAAARGRLVGRIMLGWIGLGVLAAAGFLVAVQLPLVPALLVQARYEIAVALLVAGLIAARSPLAWVNQIGRHGTAESLSLTLNAAATAPALLIAPASSMVVLLARLAGAAVSLLFSLWTFRARSRPQ